MERVCGEVRALGRRARAWPLDLREAGGLDDLRDGVHAEFGGVDILVNNSGIPGVTAAVHELAEADWDEVMNVNLKGVYRVSRAFLPAMIERGGGAVVNVASLVGQYGYAFRSPYCVSKWGVIGLTLTMALELAPHRIRVNAVNDVPVATGNTVIASEDVPLVIGPSDFDFTDVEGDSLASVTITGLTLNGGTLTHSSGAVTVTNGMTVTAAELADLTFTSALNDSTTSSFTYTVNDAGTGVTSAVMNITVNAVAPGAVSGQRLDRVFEGLAGARGSTPEQVREAMLGAIPLEKIVDPEEVAPTCVFLASAEAGMIT
ncbi:MAG: SDR family NAD(P)-dependent oxidoreductase, partial [Deltaproteobacteria bacterium]|nr:SDR family NAD(P)-dependent oxidoreductase [Deltaproteobacteria bacterium]